MLNALARHDLRDPFCLPDEKRDWRDGIEDGVKGLRIALIRRQGFDAPLDAEGHAALEHADVYAAQAAELWPQWQAEWRRMEVLARSRKWKVTPLRIAPPVSRIAAASRRWALGKSRP